LRALLIDDHALFRQGLKFILSDLDTDMDFLEATCCEQALAIPREQNVDLILLDMNMPGVNGVEALDAVRLAFESSIVVVLSSEDSPGLIRRAIEHGAAGFIPKASTPPVFIAALRLILAGGTYLPPHALGSMPPEVSQADAQANEGRSPMIEGLSDRQLEVLLKAVQGKANKVIAREMDLAEGTVKAHLSASFRALGVQNRTEAVFVAARLGLTELNTKAG
jgi:DNA-binding NarL/FixJ family response regulator